MKGECTYISVSLDTVLMLMTCKPANSIQSRSPYSEGTWQKGKVPLYRDHPLFRTPLYRDLDCTCVKYRYIGTIRYSGHRYIGTSIVRVYE